MKNYAAIAAITCTLLGCGGGNGGGNDPNATANPAQGIWNGSFRESNGNTTDLTFVVLENGDLWGIQATEATHSGGIMHGKLEASNGAFTYTMRMYFSDKTAISNPSASGTYTARQALNFTGSEPVQTSYNEAYEAKASLRNLAGTYTGNAMSKNNVVTDLDVTINEDGEISGGDASACFVLGQATPRASGKNVFDVTLHAQGQDCPSGTSGTSGIGLLLGNELTLMTENAAHNDVVGFSGNK